MRIAWIPLLFLLQVVLLVFSSIRAGVEEHSGSSLDAPHENPAVDVTAFGRHEADVVLDAALVLQNWRSASEVLLVAGSTYLTAGEPYELRLAFTDPRLRGGHLGRGKRPQRPAPQVLARGHRLSDEFGPRAVEVEGTYRGVHEGVHALGIMESAVSYDRFGGGTSNFRLSGLALRAGGCVVAPSWCGAFLLLSLRDKEDLGFDVADLDEWAGRFERAARVDEPLRHDAVERAADHLHAGDSGYSSDDFLRVVDSGLEFAHLAVLLADRGLTDRARDLLPVDPVALRQRAERVERVLPPRARGRVADRDFYDEAARRTTALTLMGALPVDGDSAISHGSRAGFHPVRALCFAADAAVVDSLARSIRDEREGAQLRADLIHAALRHPELGESAEARAAWRELRPHILWRAGVRARIAGMGWPAIFLWMAIPWLMAGAWTVGSSRRRDLAEPRFTRLGLFVALLVALVGLGGLAPGFLGAPLWLYLVRRWLGSAPRPSWHRFLAFFTTGASLSLVLREIGWLPTAPWVEPWVDSAWVLGVILLGTQLSSRPDRWNVPAWTLYLGLVVASSWADALGVDSGLPALLGWGGLAVLVMFFAGSKGDPPVGQRMIDARRAAARSASTPSASATLADPKS